MAASSDEEALELTNDTDYGLVNAVLTGSTDRGLAFAERVESGMVHVNDSTCLDEAHVPFGGMGASGSAAARAARRIWRSSPSAAGSASSERGSSTRTDAMRGLRSHSSQSVTCDLLVIGAASPATSAGARAGRRGRASWWSRRTAGLAAPGPCPPASSGRRRIARRCATGLSARRPRAGRCSRRRLRRRCRAGARRRRRRQRALGGANGVRRRPPNRHRGVARGGAGADRAGGRIAFQHAATDLIVDGDEVRGARVSGPGGDEEITAGAVLLATGASRATPASCGG